jgi:hypothetical protein
MGADVNQTIANGDTPLSFAARAYSHAVERNMYNLSIVQCLVIELGADVNQGNHRGETPLFLAASMGNTAMLRCLIELGARIGAVERSGLTAFLASADAGHYSTMQYFLEEAGANMEDYDNDGMSVWDFLIERFGENPHDYEDDHPVAQAKLLRVMVLRGAPPPALVALLSPEPARVVQDGARLRARLPAYLAHRRAYLDLRCPRISPLPCVLRALIYTFEGPATTEELWATGLGHSP